MRNLTRALVATLLLATLPLTGNAAVFVSVTIAPPALPVYVAPAIPAPGYFWVPGYWAWNGVGYYWVPGTWVLAPEIGLLWTPGYWGWAGGVYLWHAGYWGPHVGFYGGINYGFGYGGFGYRGGVWQANTFVANTTVINNTTVVNNTTINRVSYNGGAGGVAASPTAAEMQAAHEHHMQMSPAQLEHQQTASRDNTLRASFNHGRPPVAATQKPGVFSGKGVVAARAVGESAPAHAASNTGAANRPFLPQPGRSTTPGNVYPSGPHGGPGNARPQDRSGEGHGAERPGRGGERDGRR